MLPSWASDTVVVVEPSWVAERGTSIPDYASPASRRTVTGCSVQPGASSEVLGDRQASTVRYSVFLPPETRVSAYAQVLVGGVAYAVDGEPRRQPSATGGLDHVLALLIDWRG